jgi:hypothetical protein
LDDPPVAFSVARLDVTALGAIAAFPVPSFLVEDLLDRSFLTVLLEDFGLDCLVAIWALPLVSDSIMCCHRHKPRVGRGEGGAGSLGLRQPVQ